MRHLLSLALCQGSEEGKPEEVPKTLAKALELATAANLQPLRVSRSHTGVGTACCTGRGCTEEVTTGKGSIYCCSRLNRVFSATQQHSNCWNTCACAVCLAQAEALALQTHHQTVQASKTAAGKPGGAAGAGKGTVAAAPAPPAAPKQAAAPAGKRKPGEPAVVGVGKGTYLAGVWACVSARSTGWAGGCNVYDVCNVH